MKVTTNAESAYSRLMTIHGEYQEMVILLGEIKQAAEAAAGGAQVDWVEVAAKIARLGAFQKAGG